MSPAKVVEFRFMIKLTDGEHDQAELCIVSPWMGYEKEPTVRFEPWVLHTGARLIPGFLGGDDLIPFPHDHDREGRRRLNQCWEPQHRQPEALSRSLSSRRERLNTQQHPS